MSIATWNDGVCETLARQLFTQLDDPTSMNIEDVQILLDAIEEAGAEATAHECRQYLAEHRYVCAQVLLFICSCCGLCTELIELRIKELDRQINRIFRNIEEHNDPADMYDLSSYENEVNALRFCLGGLYELPRPQLMQMSYNWVF